MLVNKYAVRAAVGAPRRNFGVSHAALNKELNYLKHQLKIMQVFVH